MWGENCTDERCEQHYNTENRILAEMFPESATKADDGEGYTLELFNVDEADGELLEHREFATYEELVAFTNGLLKKPTGEGA
jgi:hypothetical protein